MAKSRKTRSKKKSTEQAKWDEVLRRYGLHELRPGFLPRRRRTKPLLDEDENKIELAAALNLDGSPLTGSEDTERQVAVSRGAFLKLADYLKLDSVGRTVLGMRLLSDFSREEVRAYFLRENPHRVSEAMSAWREFSKRIPEIRAFLGGYRQDREVPAKRRYRLHD